MLRALALLGIMLASFSYTTKLRDPCDGRYVLACCWLLPRPSHKGGGPATTHGWATFAFCLCVFCLCVAFCLLLLLLQLLGAGCWLQAAGCWVLGAGCWLGYI